MSETRQCQNCKTSFTIAPEDFVFYQKIQVPAPTWCPECRLVRHMVFCNERALYQGVCKLCNKNMITMYAPDSAHTIYCYECWQSDKWDAASYGRAFDPAKPFFTQFRELKKVVPRMGLVKQGEMSTSEYCNRASNNRNCYLCFRASNNEDCYYSHYLIESKDCMDCFNIQRCELCYACLDCFDCYNVRFSRESQNCADSAFLYDCRNCQDCFGCVNLRNKRNCIFNVQYSAEEYRKKIKEWNLANPAIFERAKSECEGIFSRGIRSAMVAVRTENSTGNWLYGCGNVQDSYMCKEVENGRRLFFITRGKDLMDVFHFGLDIEQVYESANIGISSSRVKFSNECFTSNSNLEYCDNCMNCTDCFGCVGLRNKKFHILNKAFSPEQYRATAEAIRRQMDEKPYTDAQGRVYRYGEFFPPELSSFAYNETIAQMYFPLSKEQILAADYRFQAPVEYERTITISANQLSSMAGTPDGLTKEVIGCAHKGQCLDQCTRAFKILPQELAYYRRLALPLPNLCPNCRHYERLRLRTPIQLWSRICMCDRAGHGWHTGRCQNEFETSYAPERKEIVYCEQCYQAEVI